MIYFTRLELLNSIFASVFFGVLFGLMYSTLNELFSFLTSLFRLLPGVINNSAYISRDGIKSLVMNKNNSVSPLIKTFLDFSYFLLFGLSLILVTYVTLDGVFRYYVPLIAFSVFLLINNINKSIFSGIIKTILDSILFIYVLILELIMYLPIKLIKHTNKLFASVILKSKKRHASHRTKKLKEKKLKELKELLRIET